MMPTVPPRLPRAASAALVLLIGGCGGGSSTQAGIATGGVPVTATNSSGSGQSTQTGAGLSPAGGVRTVLAPLGLNLHGAAAANAPVLATLGEGTTVTVVSHTAAGATGWYQVKGETQTGWISDDPSLSSPRELSEYDNDTGGFRVLYPTTWTFAESGGSAQFRPQSGGQQTITVVTAATLAALGQPGRTGYAVVSTAALEVYGVTGVLRRFDRSAGVPLASAAPVTPLPAGATPQATALAVPNLAHLAEIRLSVRSTYAMRIDYDYSNDADLAVFQDFYNSMYLQAASTTPTPSPGH